MQIANPIYDAVFKFMMKDNKVAKLLLSAIIGEEIIKLDFRPTELEIPLNEAITVLRMDFNALVHYQDGTEQLIIIEIQKAKLHTDIMRFRRYLGEQYMNSSNSKEVETARDGIRKKAFPILSIYFLGHPLEHATDIPVIKVARQYYNLATGEVLTEKEEFIESLTHDSYIIQIRYLSGNRGTELEQLLSIFDQSNQGKDFHILTIKEEEVPKRYRPVLRRLLLAIADAKVRQLMNAEDDIIEEFQNYTRLIEKKEQIIGEKEQEIKNFKQTINNAILQLHTSGMEANQIAKILNVSVEKVQNTIK